MYAIFHGAYGWQVIHIDRGVARIVAGTVDQEHAVRIRDLLERHGMEDVPLEEVAGHAE